MVLFSKIEFNMIHDLFPEICFFGFKNGQIFGSILIDLLHLFSGFSDIFSQLFYNISLNILTYFHFTWIHFHLSFLKYLLISILLAPIVYQRYLPKI